MRASTAYFAGAGTVIAAIVAGIGGGLLFADMVSPKTPKQELTRLEQRMSDKPIDVKAAPSEPNPIPATPPSPTTAAAPAAPAQPPAQTAATPDAPTPNPPQAQVAAPSEPRTSPAGPKQAATAPEDSFARAKDVDVKRAATEKRRSERRQQWSEKRRYQRREDPDQELREVEAKVREETETTGGFFRADPVRSEGRRIRVIDLD